MDNKEVINWLTRIRDRLMPTISKQYEALTIAIAALEQQGEENEWCLDCKEYDKEQHCCHRFTKVIRQAVEEHRREWPNGKWIPVTERLPELTHFMYDVTPFSDTVLVTMRNQYGAERLVLGNYEQRKGWNFELLNSTDERFQWHAIAWRPLPKAYREDKA